MVYNMENKYMARPWSKSIIIPIMKKGHSKKML